MFYIFKREKINILKNEHKINILELAKQNNNFNLAITVYCLNSLYKMFIIKQILYFFKLRILIQNLCDVVDWNGFEEF